MQLVKFNPYTAQIPVYNEGWFGLTYLAQHQVADILKVDWKIVNSPMTFLSDGKRVYKTIMTGPMTLYFKIDWSEPYNDLGSGWKKLPIECRIKIWEYAIVSFAVSHNIQSCSEHERVVFSRASDLFLFTW